MVELRRRGEDSQALITVAGPPVGYLYWQILSRHDLIEAGLSELPGDIVDVDIMIGEPDALGNGIGPKALSLLFERLRCQGVSLVGLAGAVAKKRAMSAYMKAGFMPFRDFYENGEKYRYFTIDLNSVDQPQVQQDTLGGC